MKCRIIVLSLVSTCREPSFHMESLSDAILFCCVLLSHLPRASLWINEAIVLVTLALGVGEWLGKRAHVGVVVFDIQEVLSVFDMGVLRGEGEWGESNKRERGMACGRTWIFKVSESRSFHRHHPNVDLDSASLLILKSRNEGHYIEIESVKYQNEGHYIDLLKCRLLL